MARENHIGHIGSLFKMTSTDQSGRLPSLGAGHTGRHQRRAGGSPGLAGGLTCLHRGATKQPKPKEKAKRHGKGRSTFRLEAKERPALPLTTVADSVMHPAKTVGHPHSFGIYRTNRNRRGIPVVVCAAWVMLVGTCSAQARPHAEPAASKQPAAPANENESSTPYERTIKGLSEIASPIIERAVTKACHARGISDARCGALRDAMVEQWRLLMDPKDQTVHDLIATYLTMRTNATPPTADEVKAWADLAHTLLDKQVVRIREA